MRQQRMSVPRNEHRCNESRISCPSWATVAGRKDNTVHTPIAIGYSHVQSNQSNFIMKCDKRTQNIESSVRMTVQKNIKKTKRVNTNILAN